MEVKIHLKVQLGTALDPYASTFSATYCDICFSNFLAPAENSLPPELKQEFSMCHHFKCPAENTDLSGLSSFLFLDNVITESYQIGLPGFDTLSSQYFVFTAPVDIYIHLTLILINFSCL